MKHPTEGEPDEEGENTAFRVFGASGAALLGLEIPVSRRVALDVAAYVSSVNTENAELGDIDLGTVNSGGLWGFRFGLFWVP